LEIEQNERVERIESSVDSLQEQYEQLMESFGKRVESGWLTDGSLHADGGAERTLVVNGGGAARKRKVIVESDEDDDSEDAVPSKRQATEPLD